MIEFIKILFAKRSGGDGLDVRRWFWGYCSYLVVLAIVSSWSFSKYSVTGEVVYRMGWLISLYMFYFSVASTFVPLPTSWFVLFLCSPVGGLSFIDPIVRVVMVGGLGALSSAISHLNEYHFGNYMLRLGRLGLIRETKLYYWAVDVFKKSPFLLLLAFNVVPIPADPARWIAIISQFPKKWFFLAQWTGRFIRYSLMGVAAYVFKLTIVQIIAFQAVLLIIPACRVVYHFVHKKYEPDTLDT